MTLLCKSLHSLSLISIILIARSYYFGLLILKVSNTLFGFVPTERWNTITIHTFLGQVKNDNFIMIILCLSYLVLYCILHKINSWFPSKYLNEHKNPAPFNFFWYRVYRQIRHKKNSPLLPLPSIEFKNRQAWGCRLCLLDSTSVSTKNNY